MARFGENPSDGESTKSRGGALTRSGTSPPPQCEDLGGIVYSPRFWEYYVCILYMFVLFCFDLECELLTTEVRNRKRQGTKMVGIT